MGALLTFNPSPTGNTTILARVGVSFVSIAQACSNAESEIPDFDFDSVRQASFNEWNELLGRIQVDTTDVDSETVSLLYSSVRHMCPDITRRAVNGVRFSSTGLMCHRRIVSSSQGWVVFALSSSQLTILDTGEDAWNSTEPYYDSFYCNVSHSRL